ncbi:MAG: cyclic nucleotide-binding domain-containing protein [Chloroflexota bacterium]|nr:cyclic nucleotide-binding domain-containing protein [Chloroflexota bacterium]
MELQQQLASIPLLAGLDDRTRRRLADTGKRRTYGQDEAIVTEGSTGTAFYIVLSGRARVVRDGEVIGELGGGDFFGELALIEEHARTASVIAAEETDCLLFPAWEFTALLEEQPQLAVQILKVLIGRLHRREHHRA